MNKAPILRKGLIVLRQPTESDIMTRAAYGISPELAQMLGLDSRQIKAFSHEDARKWYESIRQHPCKWIIEYDHQFIGVVSLRPYHDDRKAKYAIELYSENTYGRGIGTKVTQMVLNYAFEVEEYHKVFLRVLDFNSRAIKCYEKCGFVQEGIDREGALINGVFCSDIYMGILSTEYKAMNL